MQSEGQIEGNLLTAGAAQDLRGVSELDRIICIDDLRKVSECDGKESIMIRDLQPFTERLLHGIGQR